MANSKSAKKRINVIAKKTLRNKIMKTRTKNAVKKLKIALETGGQAETGAALARAISTIDRAASKGVFHRNNASRKKSRLTKMVNREMQA